MTKQNVFLGDIDHFMSLIRNKAPVDEVMKQMDTVQENASFTNFAVLQPYRKKVYEFCVAAASTLKARGTEDDLHRAIGLLDKALGLREASPKDCCFAATALGDVYERLGNYTAAEQHYTKALAYEPRAKT